MSIINQLVEEIKDIVPVVDIRWRDAATDPPDKDRNRHIFVYCKKIDRFDNGPVFAYYGTYDMETDGFWRTWYTYGGFSIKIEEFWWIPTDFLMKIPLPKRET